MERINFCRENVQYAKAVKSGPMLRMVEVKPVGDYINGLPKTRKKRENKKMDNGRFESSLARSRSKVREHIWNNFVNGSSFLTLTYEDDGMNVCKYDESLRHFDLFIKELRKKYPDIRYIAVAEEQLKRKYKYGLEHGPIHYHILVDKRNISEKYVNKIWSHGLVFKQKTYGKPVKLVNYVTKYMTKDALVKVGRKSYLISRNLLKSEVVKGIYEAYDFAMNILKKNPSFELFAEYEFDTFIGRVHIVDFYFPHQHLHFEKESG